MATARIREVWDSRLRVSERELVLALAGIPRQRVFDSDGEPRRWLAFDRSEAQRIRIALRDLEQLGTEASYALGYSRAMADVRPHKR